MGVDWGLEHANLVQLFVYSRIPQDAVKKHVFSLHFEIGTRIHGGRLGLLVALGSSLFENVKNHLFSLRFEMLRFYYEFM